jgi:signal transduction histidine kinase
MSSDDPLPVSPDPVLSVAGLCELLPDGLVMVRGDRVVELVNREACRILTCEPEVMVGRPLTEALPLVDLAGRDWWAESDPWEALPSVTGHREKLLVGAGGREVLVTARYLRGERGGPLERVMIGLRDAEARLRAERETATVLTTVAHELRAPLTSVTGFTTSLLRRWERFTDEQKRLMIETIQSDATRLTRLITELLDISRLDSDRLSLRLGPVDIEKLVRRHVVRDAVGRAREEIELALGPRAREHGLPQLWADADRLDQVFFNLIENARGHGAGQVTVTLDRVTGADTDPPDPAVVIYVDDEGVGVPEDDRGKVFDRFWRGHSNVTTGLGLYVVRGLVEAHGGSVAVGSSETGGARFIVRLPAGMPGYLPSRSGDGAAP